MTVGKEREKPYAVQHQHDGIAKTTRYYATRAQAERAMARSDYAVLWHWDGKAWKQDGIRAVFRAVTATVLAATLGLTAAQAHAYCWIPSGGGAAQQLYSLCLEQERQNQLLEQQQRQLEQQMERQRWERQQMPNQPYPWH